MTALASPWSTPLRAEDLRSQRVLVWGAGAEGRAAVRLARQYGATVSVVDEGPGSAELEGLVVHRGSGIDAAADEADVVIKSPGVSPYHGLLRTVIDRGIPVTGGTALWLAETRGRQTIAVTGSKGKSTTSSLIAHLLSGVGRSAELAGNIGTAPAELLQRDTHGAGSLPALGSEHWTVLELSSYQTSEVHHSPEIGVLTALFPEHLDWHEGPDRYYSDKLNLFAHRAPGDVVFVDGSNAEIAARLGGVGPLAGAKTYGSQGNMYADSRYGKISDKIGPFFDLSVSPLLGHHNAVNLCGALSAIRAAGVDLRLNADALLSALATFRPLAHRLEIVGELRARTVVDDSLSTAPEAAAAALAAFADRPVAIIVGGHNRGVTYEALGASVANRRCDTWVIGVPETGPTIVETINQAISTSSRRDDGVTRVALTAEDFDSGVLHADQFAPEGGVVLLSPGAPSYGRFANYRERGQRFRHVLGLSTEEPRNGR